MTVTETTPEKQPDWRIEDVMDWFGVSRSTVNKWMKLEDGAAIPCYRPGGTVLRFSSVEVKEWGFSR